MCLKQHSLIFNLRKSDFFIAQLKVEIKLSKYTTGTFTYWSLLWTSKVDHSWHQFVHHEGTKQVTYRQSLTIGEATVAIRYLDASLLVDAKQARRAGGIFVLLHTARSTVIITLPWMEKFYNGSVGKDASDKMFHWYQCVDTFPQRQNQNLKWYRCDVI